jgi:hypothetical protein
MASLHHNRKRKKPKIPEKSRLHVAEKGKEKAKPINTIMKRYPVKFLTNKRTVNLYN